MLLVRPAVGHRHWFAFGNAEELMRAGYEATIRALDEAKDVLMRPGGVYPRRVVTIDVDRDRCIGCGLCVAMAPRVMAMGSDAKAYPVASSVEWSPADGDFVHHCPTQAIGVRAEHGRRRTTHPSIEPSLEAADD